MITNPDSKIPQSRNRYTVSILRLWDLGIISPGSFARIRVAICLVVSERRQKTKPAKMENSDAPPSTNARCAWNSSIKAFICMPAWN